MALRSLMLSMMGGLLIFSATANAAPAQGTSAGFSKTMMELSEIITQNTNDRDFREILRVSTHLSPYAFDLNLPLRNLVDQAISESASRRQLHLLVQGFLSYANTPEPFSNRKSVQFTDRQIVLLKNLASSRL